MSSNNEIKFIVFSDIMYGVVIGVGFNFVVGALETLQASSILLLIWAYFVICDDWFGAHYMASHYSYNIRIFLIDIITMLNFILFLYYASRSSTNIFWTLMIYPLLAFIWNNFYLEICADIKEESDVLNIWSLGSLALFSIFVFLLILYDLLAVDILGISDSIICIVIWILWRCIIATITKKKINKIV